MFKVFMLGGLLILFGLGWWERRSSKRKYVNLRLRMFQTKAKIRSVR